MSIKLRRWEECEQIRNSYRENEVLSDILTGNILRHSCFMFKYSMTESNQWNLLLGKHELAYANMTSWKYVA